IAKDPNVDLVYFQYGAIPHLADKLIDVVMETRPKLTKPFGVGWPLPAKSVAERLPSSGIYPFPDHSRALRAFGHVVRYAEALRSAEHADALPAARPFDWSPFIPDASASTIVCEDVCHAIMAAA